MRYAFSSLIILLLFSCGNVSNPGNVDNVLSPTSIVDTTGKYAPGTWQFFLQHLPVVTKPIVDYRGKEINDQQKAVGTIPFDVGTADLQQCADALMRLRAEYLFDQKRYSEIGFHFVSGDYYTWNEYCNGLRPVARGNRIKFTHTKPSEKTHESLRHYLDLVYTYASTISLSKELKTASEFEIGTIVIYAEVLGIVLSLLMKL